MDPFYVQWGYNFIVYQHCIIMVSLYKHKMLYAELVENNSFTEFTGGELSVSNDINPLRVNTKSVTTKDMYIVFIILMKISLVYTNDCMGSQSFITRKYIRRMMNARMLID